MISHFSSKKQPVYPFLAQFRAATKGPTDALSYGPLQPSVQEEVVAIWQFKIFGFTILWTYPLHISSVSHSDLQKVMFCPSQAHLR